MLNGLSRGFRRAASFFGYDAATPQNKRKDRGGPIRSEDAVLGKSARRKVISTANEVHRNFAIAGWMIRKHLDYTTQFTLRCKTDDEGFNKEFEEFIDERSKKENCDIAGRHELPTFMRIAETRSLVDNDVAIVRLGSGHSQGLEGDRIRNPPKQGKNDRWIHGVRVNAAGRALGYAAFSRGDNGSGYEFDRTIKAGNLYLHGCYDRYDQVRGVSPILAGLTNLQDADEGFDMGLAKLKVEQLFALAIFREATEGFGDTSATEEDDESTEADERKYQVDFGAGPVLLDLDDGDRAEFLKSDAPGANAVPFLNSVIAVTLKSLDIPFSFYDESFTNFFGSKAAWQHYNRSCVSKRKRNAALHNWWTVGQTLWGVVNNEIKLPAGVRLRKQFWEWVPSGMPWWDQLKEINGDKAAVTGGFDNPYDICKRRGDKSFEENIDLTAKAYEYAKKRGVPLDYGIVPETVEVVKKDA